MRIALQAAGGNTPRAGDRQSRLAGDAGFALRGVAAGKPARRSRSSFAATCRTAQAAHEHVLVEGVGGWFVPITREYFMSDFAAELGWPVIVVVANRLGALNHTLLTVRAIQAQGLACAGVIINEIVPPGLSNPLITSGNRLILETILDVPILGELAYGARTIHWWRQPLSGK